MNNELNPTDNAKAIQRATVLDALRSKPTGTIEFRERYGIAHPAGRVMELRSAGHSINTLSCVVHDDQQRPHRSAVYVLGAAA